MANEMVVASSEAMQPTTFAELRALAESAAASRFFGAANKDQALMLMMAGRDLGLTYTQALRAFHVIEGKPTLSADGMVAVCLGRKDICEYFKTIESSHEHATVETKRVGQDPHRVTFTLDDAHRAGLVKEKGGWGKYPGRMCLARARAFAAREVYPDLLMGLYDPDEIEPKAIKAPEFRVIEDKRHAAPIAANDFGGGINSSQLAAQQNAAMMQAAGLQASLNNQWAQVNQQQVIDATPDSEPEIEEETLVQALSRRIGEATTRAELDGLAGEIAQVKDQLTDGQQAALRGAWKERAGALKGAA